MKHPPLVLTTLLFLGLVPACGEAGGGPMDFVEGESTDGVTLAGGGLAADAIDDYILDGLLAWPEPDGLLDDEGNPVLDENDDPAREAKFGDPVESIEEESDGSGFYHCSAQKMGLAESFDNILAVAGNSGVLWPGAMVQGKTIRDGNPTLLALRRSSIDVSIDLAIPRPSATLKEPTSASYQDVLSDFQRQADETFGDMGETSVVPARLNYVRQEAHSFQQLMIKAGLHGKYNGPALEASLSASFGLNRSSKAHTLVVRMLQPMYTVTFADEAKDRPSDYFDSEVTLDDFEFEQRRGSIGPQNQPCYIKSVTYGRMLVFTLTSTEVASALELQVAFEATYGLGSGGGDFSLEAKNKIQNSTVQMTAFGGSQEDALAVITTNDVNAFFKPAPASTAVPLVYRVHTLRDGLTATIGDATTYTVRTCTPIGDQRRHRFDIKLAKVEMSEDSDPRGLADIPGATAQFVYKATASIFVNRGNNTGERYVVLDDEVHDFGVAPIDRTVFFDVSDTTPGFSINSAIVPPATA